MVFGSDDGIFSAGFFDEVNPVIRIIMACSEAFDLRHVLVIRHFTIKKSPTFIYTIHRIDAPMDEDP